MEPASAAAFSALVMLVLLAVLFLAWPVWRATLPLEVWGNEGWNAYHADAAFSAKLYPPADDLVANNYPPLSYYLIGALSSVFGDAVYIGRAISLTATLILGLCAAIVAHRFGAGRIGAALAAAWFVATMARFFDFYVGMNEPQLPAQAIMNIGLVWFLARMHANRAVEPAVLLMVVAGFYKHNIIVVPTVALIWLALHDMRRAVRATVTGVAAAVSGLTVLALAYPDFVADMLMPRNYYPYRWLDSLGRTQFVLPALIIWAVWAWRERGTAAAKFTTLLVGFSFLTYLAQKSGDGVDENAQFELIFATSVGVGIAFNRLALNPLPGWSAHRVVAAVAIVLVLRLAASARTEFAYVLLSPEYRAMAANHAAIARAEAARVAAIPANVACTNLVVCRMAGKPFVFDNFKVPQMLITNAYSERHVAERMAALRIVRAAVDPRASATSIFKRN